MGTKSYCIALVCPQEPALKALGGADKSIKELCASKACIDAVLADCIEACKAAKCAKFEIPTKVILIEELWTPDNNMLTAVNKLKRKEIKTKHLAEIEAVYK